jgi:SAM-dependent methyltransferase
MNTHGHPRAPLGASDWDERYANHTHRAPNDKPSEILVAEVGRLLPGRGLEVGCGEGTDAIWLASTGWQMTATDISRVGIDRAAATASERGLTVDWACGAFEDLSFEPVSFDLLVTLYPALRRRPDHATVDSLISAVAPGGTLLVVGHATTDQEERRSHGLDPAVYVQPSDLASRLGDDWRIEVDEVRRRTSDGSHGAPHSADTVLKATRRG